MAAKVRTTLNLSPGVSMPVVGFGTFDNTKVDKIGDAVKAALDAGYRHIDCAFIYRCEKAVGAAIADKVKEDVVRREDLFITTKLWNTFHEPERVELGLRKSLEDLGLDYVDLFLIHWPMAVKEQKEGRNLEPTPVDFVDTWKAMEDLVDKGLAKTIGISNFNIQQIQRLLKAPLRIKPVNNQVESHPYFSNQELIDFCRSQDMTVSAFSPLAIGGAVYVGEQLQNLLEDPKITEIANRLNRTPAQVILRWSLQRGIAVVVKSCTPSRIQENFQVFDFELSEDDMKTIKSMDVNARVVINKRYKNIPEYPF